MNTIHVTTQQASYPIYIGQNALQHADNLLQHMKGAQVLLVTNHTVAALHKEKITRHLKTGEKIYNEIILPDGEQFKNLSTLTLIFDSLLSKQYGRDCTLVALGGGVIGDMTGFAAACYQRGVNFIQIPTTLLAQVDAAVGGKTAVNHYAGKNMIGAFHQPQCVISDLSTLTTLTAREYRAGLAEVIKHGLIYDSTFWTWLLQNIQPILQQEHTALEHVVATCCAIKATVVAHDEKEHGLRAILNFGHTVAHALESGLGYGVVLHGEAVAIGMLVATRLSVLLGYIDASVVTQLHELLTHIGLPTQPPEQFTKAQCWQHMRLDKKIKEQQLRFIVLHNIGEARVLSNVPNMIIDQALEQTGFKD